MPHWMEKVSFRMPSIFTMKTETINFLPPDHRAAGSFKQEKQNE